MFSIHYLNPISPKGTALWTEDYQEVPALEDAQAVLVRSTSMHDLPFPKNLLAVARAGAGVNNIPLEKCAEAGIVVFNTPGANANGVMELALCGMLLGSRDVIGGINWVQSIRGSSQLIPPTISRQASSMPHRASSITEFALAPGVLNTTMP